MQIFLYIHFKHAEILMSKNSAVVEIFSVSNFCSIGKFCRVKKHNVTECFALKRHGEKADIYISEK